MVSPYSVYVCLEILCLFVCLFVCFDIMQKKKKKKKPPKKSFSEIIWSKNFEILEFSSQRKIRFWSTGFISLYNHDIIFHQGIHRYMVWTGFYRKFTQRADPLLSHCQLLASHHSGSCSPSLLPDRDGEEWPGISINKKFLEYQEAFFLVDS